jgi:Transposase DDE domain
MTSIPEVADTVWRILAAVASEVERSSGFVQRRSKLTGALFVQTVVLGWVAHPAATLEQLSQMAARLGIRITPQGLEQRFTSGASVLLENVLNAAVTEVVAAAPVALPILERFAAVTVQDSSTITLPPVWAEHWPGCGGSTPAGDSALKLDLRWDLLSGRLEGPIVTAGRAADQRALLLRRPVAAGALRLQDLGYFSLDEFARMAERDEYWFSRWLLGTALFDPDGARIADLPRWLSARRHARTLDLPVTVGSRHRLPARLLVVRVPRAVAVERRRRLREAACEQGRAVNPTAWRLARWTIWLTNVPAQLLTVREAQVVARARWQIELLFKLWKQHGLVDDWRTARPDRILCEVFAKLVGVLLQHWLFVTAWWQYPDRSYVKAAQTIRDSAILLASALVGLASLSAVLEQLARCAAAGCRINSRRTKPNTFQLFRVLPDGSLA